ncbi:MAG: DUF3899 domain-containing protein [Lachnospiraceae bacterium]
MKQKRRWNTYLAAIAVAIAIAFINIYFEISTYGKETVLLMHFFSDGFFVSAVLYLGCGALVFISDAGNFYGIQYLGYAVVYLFSFRKERFEQRKDYYTYCMEKKAKQKERGKDSVKWVLLFVGLGCLLFSVIFAVIFYQMV